MNPQPSEPASKFPLNGLSIDSLSINQDGDLRVEFDLPNPQTTARYHAQLKGVRVIDVYEDKELQAAAKLLFDLVRRRLEEPDPERLKVHCDRCASSACCRDYNVLVTDEDMARLAEHLGLALPAFREKHTRPAVDWCEDFPAQLACDTDELDGREKCVFLKRAPGGQLRCSVYEHRPKICRDFDMNSCDDFVPLDKVTTIGRTAAGG